MHFMKKIMYILDAKWIYLSINWINHRMRKTKRLIDEKIHCYLKLIFAYHRIFISCVAWKKICAFISRFTQSYALTWNNFMLCKLITIYLRQLFYQVYLWFSGMFSRANITFLYALSSATIILRTTNRNGKQSQLIVSPWFRLNINDKECNNQENDPYDRFCCFSNLTFDIYYC